MQPQTKKILIQYIKNLKEEKEDSETFSEFVKLIQRTAFTPKEYKKLVHQYEESHRSYMYMITFTLDPKKNDFNNALYDASEKYIKKLLLNPNRKLTTFDIVREGTDEDHKHTHWHCGVITKGKYLSMDNFKTYIKNFGNIDISKSINNDYEDILTYINKQYNSLRILPKKGLPSSIT